MSAFFTEIKPFPQFPRVRRLDIVVFFSGIGTDILHPRLFLKLQVRSSSRNLSELVTALTCLVLCTCVRACALNNGLVISCLTLNKPVNFSKITSDLQYR